VLAFLPGARKSPPPRILGGAVVHDAGIEIVPLFGALDAGVQECRHRPSAEGPPQGRAGDIDRGDVMTIRRGPHCRRFRHGAACRANEPTLG